ncbi:hypothetical protein SAMN05216474_0967 [Lishizhenia tianjinensis]|uniref:DUF493 domain-containing protein n=1 Tax=Lishizhenia tianjinensis TaxID=477690 RepID=A0A1I6YKZ0_9FLAO|nr:DUF493 family protein [Lishizhenia tianjinensis]SFT50901.1 hypothetical protein SAMN05216474_0967 [Lishizhenia tianjinensis]
MKDVFEGLKEKLQDQEWPAVYFFKFVCPNDNETVAKVVAHFNEESEIEYHNSRTGKYVSVSVKELMLDVDSIIDIYQKVATIKGVIAL